jgi:hypothetical protein
MAIHSSIAKLTKCKHIINHNNYHINWRYKFIFINVYELPHNISTLIITSQAQKDLLKMLKKWNINDINSCPSMSMKSKTTIQV